MGRTIRRRRMAGLTLAVVSVMLGAAAPPARAEFTLAVAVPLSGALAGIGQDTTLGAETAVADINAAGGALGQSLRLEIQDDACDATRAAEIANRMKADKVAAVIGHPCSSAAIPASLVYQEDEVLMITTGATLPWLTERGLDLIFRLCARDEAQTALAVAHLAQAPVLEPPASQSVAILHDSSAYGAGLADQVKRGLNRAGIEEALYDGLEPGASDIAQMVQRLKAHDVPVIYYGGYFEPLKAFLTAAAAQSYAPRIVGGDALARSDFGPLVGPAPERVIVTYGALPDPGPLADRLAGLAMKRRGVLTPTFFNAYAAVRLWAAAASSAGSPDPRRVAAQLRLNVVDTVLGPVGFDAKGDSLGPSFRLYQWKEGRFQPMEPAAVLTR